MILQTIGCGLLGIWLSAGILAICTDRDYGRAACLGRDAHELFSIILIAPFLALVFAVVVPIALVSRVTRPSPKDSHNG